MDILLVEDNDDLRDATADFLQAEGFIVGQARDGLQAYELLKAGACPKVMLLDLMMPRLDGAGLLKLLREQPVECHPHIVVLTALATATAQSLGVEELLHKPANLERLLGLLREMVV